jgi:hypothetical protein
MPASAAVKQIERHYPGCYSPKPLRAPNTFLRQYGLASVAACLLSLFVCLHAASAQPFERENGGIVRGPKATKSIGLVFTGHEFAEGGETILNELARHRAKASFF